MKRWLWMICLLSCWGFGSSAQASVDKQTKHWEQQVVTSLHTVLCGTKGQFSSTFHLSAGHCSKTYWKAAKQCRSSMQKLPFYKVFNQKSGSLWGRYLGLCIGIAFNMKYVFHRALPTSNPSQ
jgi:hypothetical protein